MTREAVRLFMEEMKKEGKRKPLMEVAGTEKAWTVVKKLIPINDLDFLDNRAIKEAVNRKTSLTNVAVALNEYLTKRYGNN